MVRCPTCHRRLAPAARCSRDGSQASGSSGPAPDAVPPTGTGIAASRLLGAGAHGSVWEASIDLPNGRTERVAVKVSHTTDAATTARFRREAAVLQALGPPHVPLLVASGKLSDGRAYLAMERLFGRTLAEEMVGFTETPPLATVAALGAAMLDATAEFHRQGVFHRDLKPENVFLVRDAGADPVAKLIDFGLTLTASMPATARTSAGMAIGTPEYMAPERIAGEDGDFRSDVYAVGVILFELLTLRPPFVGDLREVEYAHLSFRPPPPSRFAVVPEPLEQVILRSLSKDPARRFPSGLAFREAFAEALAATGLGGAAPAALTTRQGAISVASRQTAAVIFMEQIHPAVLEIQACVQPFGGLLAHLAGNRCVFAFTHRAGDHPGQRALAAAEALVAAGLARRLVVDVGSVAVRPRSDGPARVTSPMFSDAGRFPGANDPEGIVITAAAREILPLIACESAQGRADHFVLLSRTEQDLIKTIELTSRDAAGPIVGREEELRILFDEAGPALAERRPRIASVIGEQGMGKTRLRLELAHQMRAEMSEVEVIDLGAREAVGKATEDEVLAELLRRTLDLPRDPPAPAQHDSVIRRLGARASEAAAAGLVLGWLAPDDPAVRSLRAAPGVLRANAARAAMTALLRLAQRRPVVVLLDDAQWADDATLDALEQATVSEVPLWVCAFAKPAFATSRPGWGQRAAGSHVLRLGPLDASATAELCRHLLEPATHTPKPVVDRLARRTEGVPLLIHDLIRSLRRNGLVRKQAGGVWVVASEVLDDLADSPLTEWLAGRELDELPTELASHARLLSLLPAEFTVQEIEGVVGAMDRTLADDFPMDVWVGTRRLHQSGLLVRRSGGRFVFRTEVMRDAVARTVPETLASRIHRAALAYHRETPAERVGRLPRMAWHAAAAGERNVSAEAYLALAEAARERHNYLEAELLYTRCLSQLDEQDTTGCLRARRGRGIMRYRLGRHDDSLADLALAQELAQAGSDAFTQADVLLDEAMALDWLFDWQRSRELADRARKLFPLGAPLAMEARILLALGRSLHRFNQDEEAAKLLRNASRLGDLARRRRIRGRQVIADLLLGFLLPFIGLPVEAEERLRRVERLCLDKGDELHLAAAWQNRSCLWITLNDRRRFDEGQRQGPGVRATPGQCHRRTIRLSEQREFSLLAR